MYKLLKFLASRLVITALFVLVQMAFLFLTIRYVENLFGLSILGSVTGLVVCFTILSHDDAPEYKLSWILLIMFLPVFGILMYLLFGNKKRSHRQRRRAEGYKDLMAAHSVDSFPKDIRQISDVLNVDDVKLSRYVSGLSDSRVFGNTSAEYFPLGDECFPHMIEELEKAKSFIFMEYFIYQHGEFWDSILEILKKKVQEGVDVRVMYDDMGSINTLPMGYYKELRSYGIKAVAFNPVRARLNFRLNYRDHRKVCIIDGNTAFSGGINIADEYINRTERFGHWKDNGFMIKGDGVWNYTFMFLQLWEFVAPKEYRTESFVPYAPTVSAEQDGYIQSFGDSPLDEFNVAENAYLHMINNAKDYVWISTPYLILDSTMTNALTLAARAGVDVRIITPAVPDKKLVFALTRANYASLLANGVKIYEYEPGFIHSKMFLSDDRNAIVGTINMDYRSFFLHFESGTIFYGGKIVSEVKKDFLETGKVCREVTQKDYAKRSRLQKLMGNICKLIAPLL